MGSQDLMVFQLSIVFGVRISILIWQIDMTLFELLKNSDILDNIVKVVNVEYYKLKVIITINMKVM